MGLLEITFIVLLVLKLIGVISVSWFVVFLPLILSVVLYLTLFLFSITISFFSYKKFK